MSGRKPSHDKKVITSMGTANPNRNRIPNQKDLLKQQKKDKEAYEKKIKELENKLSASNSKEVLLENKLKEVEKNAKLNLGLKPKYSHDKTILDQELIKDIKTVLINGVFPTVRIAGILGIHRNTLENWIKQGRNPEEPEDSIYRQLVLEMEYTKSILFQQFFGSMKELAIVGKDFGALKYGMSAMFEEMRFDQKTTKTSVNISDNTYTKPSEKDSKVQQISRDISFIIEESASSDDDGELEL